MKGLIFFLVIVGTALHSQEALEIQASDVYIEARSDGYHLFVRDRDAIGSILITESFEPTGNLIPTYALRALDYNKINGEEKRMLNGEFIQRPLFSLIDSTPSYSEELDSQAFHILIPPKIEYGYSYTQRQGSYDLTAFGPEDEPFWFSIRAFERPFGDYRGAYRDNAFEIRINQRQIQQEQPSEGYLEGLEENFSRISRRTIASSGKEELIDTIHGLIRELDTESLDLVLAVDTSRSMKNNLVFLQRDLLGPVETLVSGFKSYRVGLLFYRDYMEEYLTRHMPFQSDFRVLQRFLNASRAFGGGDIPEAVLEALYASLNNYNWQAETRMIILIGDAPQHPVPRGDVTEAMVRETSKRLNVEIVAIMLPQE